MAQGVDGHSPSDNSEKTRLREASIMTGMTKYEARFCWLVICHSGFLCDSVFIIRHFFYIASDRQFCYREGLNFQMVEVTTKICFTSFGISSSASS
jgi:hypothetical protein